MNYINNFFVDDATMTKEKIIDQQKDETSGNKGIQKGFSGSDEKPLYKGND